MIGVHRHRISVYFGNHQVDLTLVGLRGDSHTGFHFLHSLEGFHRHLLNTVVAALAVGIGRLDDNFEFIANHLSLQGLFQAWDDVLCAVQVGHRLGIFRGINDFIIFGIGDLVMNGDNLVLSNSHVFSMLCIPLRDR